MSSKQYMRALGGSFFLGLALLAAGLLWTTAADSDTPAPALKIGTNAIPRSIFLDDERGRDPFFPNSTRRQHKVSVPVPTAAVGPSSLVLLGITGPPDNRLALINNQNFFSGEEHRVRIPGGSSLVKCEEIRERSVVVSIQGGTERFEIHLLERTLPIAPENQLLE